MFFSISLFLFVLQSLWCLNSQFQVLLRHLLVFRLLVQMLNLMVSLQCGFFFQVLFLMFRLAEQHVTISFLFGRKTFCFLFIYASVFHVARRQLWSFLSSFSSSIDIP